MTGGVNYCRRRPWLPIYPRGLLCDQAVLHEIAVVYLSFTGFSIHKIQIIFFLEKIITHQF